MERDTDIGQRGRGRRVAAKPASDAVRWLPIGTVAVVKGFDGPLVVAGVRVQNPETGGYWDYLGFPYPMGFSAGSAARYFNADMVASVRQLGLCDADSMRFNHEIGEVADGASRPRPGSPEGGPEGVTVGILQAWGAEGAARHA